jgi:hypothetical protein
MLFQPRIHDAPCAFTRPSLTQTQDNHESARHDARGTGDQSPNCHRFPA